MTAAMENATSESSRLLAAWIQQDKLELPSMPDTAAQVMDLSRQESTDARRLSEVIHGDQTIATSVLRVANSAAYVGQVPCSSLQQAIGRLGLQMITEIAMAVSLRGRLFRNDSCVELLAEQWRHSVLVGFFTKEIARMRRRNVEIAFLCGLLHDVGKAVLLNGADRVLAENDLELSQAELVRAVHEQHVAAGRLLAARWQLPEQIAEAIVCHHEPNAAEQHADMAMMVQLADLLGHLTQPGRYDVEVGVAVAEDELRGHDVLVGLNIYQDQFDSLLALRQRAQEITEGLL